MEGTSMILSKKGSGSLRFNGMNGDAVMDINDLIVEIERLRKENERLRVENKQLGVIKEVIENVDPAVFLAAAKEHLGDVEETKSEMKTLTPIIFEVDTHPLLIDLVGFSQKLIIKSFGERFW
jgi:hypothetical protein